MRELSKIEMNNIEGGAFTLPAGLTTNKLMVTSAVAMYAVTALSPLFMGKTKWNKEEGIAYNMCFNTVGMATYPLNRVYASLKEVAVWGVDAARGVVDGITWGLTGCK